MATNPVNPVPTNPTPPPLTPDQFRAVAPAFKDPVLYPDASIEFWITVAAFMLTPRWGPALGLGIVLFVSHNLVLMAWNQRAADTGQIPGMMPGVTSSQAAGAVSVSYDTGVASEPDAGHWNLTVYGRKFIRMARMFGAGPIQLNVPSGGAGLLWTPLANTQLPYSYSFGPGWVAQPPANNVQNTPLATYIPGQPPSVGGGTNLS